MTGIPLNLVTAAADDPVTDVDAVTRRFLAYVLLPLWVVPGLLDWWFHRRSHIETTTGLKEAALHTAMMAELGAPIAAAMTMRVTRPVYGAMGAAALAHAVTSMWDVRMAYNSTRDVTPGEQQVHSVLEVLPLTALATIGALHWEQIRHPTPGQPALQLRHPPLPRWYLTGAALAAAAGIAGPYTNEMRRCLRAASHPRHHEPCSPE